MALIWERNGESYYATVTGPSDEVRFYQTVETDGDRWDWLVWRPDESADQARLGVAVSVQEAMRAAERAAGV